MKPCPFCAEEIQDDAIKCRYCYEFFDGHEAIGKGKKDPWYFSLSTIVIGFLFVGPLILPLVWLNPRISKTTKTVITLIMLLISWWLAKAFTYSFKYLHQYYQLLQGTY